MGGWTPLPDFAQPKARNTQQSVGGWTPLGLPGQSSTPDASGGWTPLPATAQPEHVQTSFGDLLKSGAAQVGQAAGGLLEAFGPTTGVQQTGQQWREQATQSMVPAMSLEQLGAGYDKVDWTSPVAVTKWLGSTLANTPRFVAENVTTQIPNIGLSAALSYGGAAAGGALAGPPGAAAGILAGSFISSYFLNAGETFADLREKGVSREAAAETAGFVGAAKGILDTALPAKLFGGLAAKTGMKVFWMPRDAAAKAPALWKAVTSGMGIEAGTEAGQELLDMWAEQQKGVYTPGGGLSRVLNSAAAGAAGGGVFGGAEYVAERMMGREEAAKAPMSELDEATPDVVPSGTKPLVSSLARDVAPEDVPKAVRDRVVELGGEDSLFRAHTEDDIKNIFELDPNKSAQPMVDRGRVIKVGDKYRLAESITGETPMVPLPDMPGMEKALDNSLLKYRFTSQVDPTQRFQIDYVPLDAQTGIGDQYRSVVDGQIFEADSLPELQAQLEESVQPPENSRMTPGGMPGVEAQGVSPEAHTPADLDTISRLFPQAQMEQTPDGAVVIKGANGIVMRKAPNGTIVVEGGKPESRDGMVASGVTRVLSPQFAAYLGGLRGTEVQVDPTVGADRQTMLHEFGWHTFLELGATEEQRAQAKLLFPNEEEGAKALASYLDDTWNARDAARSKLLFDITQWFKNIYYQLMGKPQALFNQAGSGDWVNNAPAAPRTLGERYELKRQGELQKANTFFDQLERVVEAKVPNAASAAQVRAIVTNPQNGVKAEQLRWTGLEEWLKEKGMNRVTKQEVLDKVRENSVQITENPRTDKVIQDSEEGSYLYDTPPPKFSSWQVPGGEAYSELLFTLPEGQSPEGKWEVFDPFEGKPIATFNSEEEAQAYVESAEDQLDYDRSENRLSAETTYASPHWDEPNVLAHTRFNSRDIKGKNTLFVEEIQSDWHQEGRKKGYADGGKLKASIDEEYSQVSREMEALRNLRSLTQAQQDQLQALNQRQLALWDQRNKAGTVPDAPFRNSWHELVFKRMLRYAAENGYEQIAWTDGKTQAERYDLSKQVSSMKYLKNGVLSARDLQGREVLNKLVTPEELPGVIGEELTAKLLAAPVGPSTGIRELSGLDLKVGGSGMKGFYDKILVDYANKYGKRWGAQVRDAEIEYEKGKKRVYEGLDYNASTFRDWVADHTEELLEQGLMGQAVRVATSLQRNRMADAMGIEGSNDLAAMLGGRLTTEKETVTVHTLPVTASMRNSVLYEGQPLFETKPTPVPSSDRPATKEMKSLNKLWRHLPGDQKAKMQDAMGRTYKVLRHGMFLTQLQDQNPNNPFVKAYVNLARANKMVKNKIQLMADGVSRVWMKAGMKNVKRVSDLLRLVNEESERKLRRLTLPEVKKLADTLGGPTDKIVEAWAAVDDSMQQALELLRAALVKEAKRTYGLDAADEIAKVNAEIDAMAKKNYFPATRFGEWGVLVKATGALEYRGRHFTKGDTIMFETTEAESQSLKLREQLQKEFPGQAEVLLRKLTPTEQNFMNMPASLADYLRNHLALSDEQFKQLKDIQYNLAPGRGLVKHMIKKQGILGASVDGLRIYNDYYRKLSGHLAKLETSSAMESVISAAKASARLDQRNYNAQLTAETLEQNYHDMSEGGNEWGAVAGGIFHLVFSFNPLAAVVNMTQVPVFTYPYLAKASNDLVAGRAIATASAKVGKMMHKSTEEKNAMYSGEDKQFFDRAVEEGFLDESLAGSINTLASSNMLTRYYEGGIQLAQQTRWLMTKSIVFFKVAEEFNRRVTFQAAIEVGRTKGLTGDNLYEFARKAVDMTQFEYSRWNRPKIMKGKASVLFIFKAYLQNFLYFAGTNQGGMRFWLMLTALAGLKGVPGADDLLDIIDLLGTWGRNFFGLKNPRLDSEKAAREFIKDVGANPDLVMNGFSRYSFGASGLNTLFGIPFPAADFSTSMQMTRLVPGMRMVKGMSQGTMKWPDAFLTAFQDVTGVAGSTGANFTRALLEDSPYAGSRLLNFSTVTRNVSRAIDMASSGSYRAPDGSTLVDVDLTKPEHLGEIIVQALGKRPTRVVNKLESKYMMNEQIGYYLSRRDTIIQHWAEALGAKDTDSVDAARKEYQKFAATAPPEFVMKGDQVRAELRKLLMKRGLKEMGLPSSKKFIRLAGETESLFQSPF